MQVNQSGSPLTSRLNPGEYRGLSLSADQLAKKTLASSGASKVFGDTQRVLAEGSRVDANLRSRAPIYQQVKRELDNVEAALGQYALSLGGSFTAPGPQSVTTNGRLNLGDGFRVNGYATTTTTVTTPGTPATPAAEKTLDPTQKLNTQPFETAITAGTLTLQFRVNGGGATNKTITINPATQSLNDVLTQLNNITISGKKPLTATFDAAAQEIKLQVNSTSGTNFDFTITGGTSNFRTVFAAEGVTTARTVTANAAIENSATRNKYYRLNVTAEGKGTVSFTNLQVSSTALSADQKVGELVTQLNAGLGSLGLTAVNAGGGKIGFTSSDPAAAAAPALGVTITQQSRTNAVRLGFQSGFTTQATLTFDPNLQDTPATPGTPATTTTTSVSTPVNTVLGGLLGPDSSLRELSGQLGLTASNGRFELDVNGTTLSFSENQTLNDVLAGIGGAGLGLTASYDANAGQITVASTDGRAVAIGDRAGNLASSLGIASTAEEQSNAALGQEIRDLATALDDVTRLVEASTARGTGFEGDRLLADLRGALNDLFSRSTDGTLSGLGDLGFSREGGELRIDAARLQQLSTDRRDELNQFLGSFVGERVAPLLRAGSDALQASEAVAPAEAEAASRSARVAGEISRLQSRQQLLTLERQSFEDLRERLEKQRETLEKNARELEERNPNGLPRLVERTAETAELLGRDRGAYTPPPPVLGPGSAAPAPGLGSFGMAEASTA